jgi:hypothetical protein
LHYLENRIRGEAGARAMRQLGLGYLGYAKAHPLEYQLMFSTPLPSPEAYPEMIARRAFGILRDTLAALPHRRTRRATADALFVWSTMHGLASIMKTNLGAELGLTDAAIPKMSRHVLDMVGKALRAPIN